MATEPNANDTAGTSATEESKTLLEQAQTVLGTAQEKIGEAFESTVGAVKEHPVAAAAIAAGAVAAVGAAAYGITQLGGAEEDSGKAAKGGKTSKK
ncbi:hypothetical protein TPR58_21150 [Sphingomonas sp. HF-S3]|uniref:Uncharacterized protein n=1 Tax=Sphingomonas rustica TaxID=3103142 RepID=A0ABV0BDS5_9SPHN